MKLSQFKKIASEVKGSKISKYKVKKKPILIEGEYNFNMDSKLYYDLKILCQDLKQDDDALIIIVAPEGSGKTVLETQIGYFISQQMKSNWGCDNIHFEGKSYQNFSLHSPQYTVVALDESRRALNKMRGMTGNNVEFNDFLSECRSNNQAHIIVLPAFSDLEKYVAIHRVKYLIQVIKNRDSKTKKIIRGNYKIINTKSKSNLLQAWKGGYKEFPNNMVMAYGKFDNVLCLDKKEYNNKKEEAKKERYSSLDNNDSNNLNEYDLTLLNKHKQGLSYRQIAKELGNKSHVAIKNHLDKLKKNNDL